MMKNWKRIAALAMSAVTVDVMLTDCGGEGKATEVAKGDEPKAEVGAQVGKDAGEAAGSGEKEQVYVSIRDRGDLSYWGSMVAGGNRVVADYVDRVDVHVVETTADLQANLQATYEAAGRGADLIIITSDLKDSLMGVANEYPDVAFTIISEDVIDQCEGNNAYDVDLAASQAAFLGGVAAADVAVNGAEDMDPTSVIGSIGGMGELLVIQEFLWGYIQGAQYYDPDIKIVYNYVGAWNGSDTAKTQAITQYNDAGADVIFAYAGGSGNGVYNTAEEARRSVTGVDSDQSQLYEDDKTIQERFLASAVREVGNAVYGAARGHLDNGTLPYGEYEALGLSDGAIDIVEGDQLNGALSGEGKAKLEEAKAGIANSSIEVKNAISKGQDEVKAFINENCQ